jgi:hypothetical protein
MSCIDLLSLLIRHVRISIISQAIAINATIKANKNNPLLGNENINTATEYINNAGISRNTD